MKSELNESRWRTLYEQAGEFARARRHEEAEKRYLEAATEAEHAFGRHDPRVVTTLESLRGLQYCDMGSYARSGPTSLRLLALRAEMLGPDHPELANDFNLLGYAYQHQNDYSQAEAKRLKPELDMQLQAVRTRLGVGRAQQDE